MTAGRGASPGTIWSTCMACTVIPAHSVDAAALLSIELREEPVNLAPDLFGLFGLNVQVRAAGDGAPAVSAEYGGLRMRKVVEPSRVGDAERHAAHSRLDCHEVRLQVDASEA